MLHWPAFNHGASNITGEFLFYLAIEFYAASYPWIPLSGSGAERQVRIGGWKGGSLTTDFTDGKGFHGWEIPDISADRDAIRQSSPPGAERQVPIVVALSGGPIREIRG
jgi:hypothetical protein